MRPLRNGLRNPKPGAVFAGCSRPHTIRFPAGAKRDLRTIFGDGSYSKNIMQGGALLLPQTAWYGGQLIEDCLTITGAATVAPGPNGSSVVTCNYLVIDGSSASLSPSSDSKGLLVFSKQGVILKNGAKLHTNAIGFGGDFGAASLDSLISPAVNPSIKREALAMYVVGLVKTAAATDATKMCAGGGGAGATGTPASCTGGAGGNAGTFRGGCGGGGGSNGNGEIWPGSAAGNFGLSYGAGGVGGSHQGWGGRGGWGGGLLGVITPYLVVLPRCLISSGGENGANGSKSSNTPCPGAGGGGGGGGIVFILTLVNGLTNLGTIQAPGGVGGSGYATGASGNVGSVNIFTLET